MCKISFTVILLNNLSGLSVMLHIAETIPKLKTRQQSQSASQSQQQQQQQQSKGQKKKGRK